MKALITSMIALIAILYYSSAANTATAATINHTMQESSTQQNIQNQIMDAFMCSFADQSNSKMTSLISELSTSYGKSRKSLFLYWKGYALYYNCIIFLKNRESVCAQKELSKAIEVL